MNNKKSLFTCLLFISFLYSYSQTDSIPSFDWKNPTFAYAKTYLYGLETDDAGSILVNGKLNATVTDTNGLLLDSLQSAIVISVIAGRSSGTPDEKSMCFIPHHGIVFYNQNHQPIAHISICFYCETKAVFPKTFKTSNGMNLLKKVITDVGLPVFELLEDYEKYGVRLRTGK